MLYKPYPVDCPDSRLLPSVSVPHTTPTIDVHTFGKHTYFLQGYYLGHNIHRTTFTSVPWHITHLTVCEKDYQREGTVISNTFCRVHKEV